MSVYAAQLVLSFDTMHSVILNSYDYCIGKKKIF